MDVQSQLLFIGSSADIKIMVAERERVDRPDWIDTSTLESVPLPSYRYGREREVHIELSLRRNNSDTRVIAVRQNRLAMWPAGKE